jgi:hypothetical protein
MHDLIQFPSGIKIRVRRLHSSHKESSVDQAMQQRQKRVKRRTQERDVLREQRKTVRTNCGTIDRHDT